jgi:hypothetical protein
MRKLYIIKASIYRQTSKLMLFAVLLIFSAFNSFSQEIVPFAPRASSANPSTTVYTVKGDFAMIGNTNLTLANYTDTRNNNNDMIYVDVDTDIDTWNSSSAYLDFSQENGAVPSCSNIIYAGLYWTGRAGSSETFSVTKNGVTKQFNKREVSLRKGTTGAYVPVIATSTSLVNNNIYFPSGTEGDMYSAYAEVTDYVKANGIGEYFVADIATVEGDGGNTGYYGGWGMVVVYENSQMNWRDVTVFDGHAYVQGSTTIDYTFDVTGFNTAQSGDINLKLGVMAGEGDVGISGDYFEIQRQDNSQFQRLSHSTNSSTNFFNSSINTGGNARNPNLVNNTGVDISMFSIDNTANGVITNNQNQTTFRYGSTQDTYVIFNVTFSVDSYVPEVTGVITNTSINGIPNPAPVIIEPGQSAQYKLEIKNAGTEATNNTLVTIPIPDTVDPTNLNFTFNTYYTPDDSSALLYDSNIGSNGAIIWNLGTLPLPSNPETVLADISFDLTATTDCSSLGDIINTPPSITLFGTISGSGAISNVSFNTPLIQGYSASDICKESPIPIPIIIPIDVTNFSTDPPTIAVPAVLTIEGCDENDITDTTARYIYSATQSADIKNNFVDVSAGYTVSNDIASITYVDVITSTSNCTLVVTRTYTATNNCGSTADAVQTITVEDTTAPVVTVPAADLSMECFDTTAVATWAATASANDNCDGTLTVTPTYTAPADNCNQTVTVTFTATDACGNIGTATKDFTVNDNTAPSITGGSALTVECDGTGNLTEYQAWLDGNAGATATDNCGVVIWSNTIVDQFNSCGATGDTEVRFTAEDECGNQSTFSAVFKIEDTTAPTIIAPSDITIQCDQDPDDINNITGTPTGISDTCSTTNVGYNDVITAGNCANNFIITRTWTATDECGNSSSDVQSITVEDTTAPVVTVPAADLSMECFDATAVATWAATASANDNCDGTLTVIPTYTAPADNCNQTVTVTFTATDACGNIGTATKDFTVDDNTAPVVTVPAADLAMECFDATAVAIWAATASANDNCDGTLTVTPTYTAPADNCNQTVTVTFTATDACGNIGTATKDFTVDDNTAPVVTVPAADLAMECFDATAVAIWAATASANDNCDGTLTVTPTYTAPADNCNQTVTVTFTATDACGNIGTVTKGFTVDDNTAPVVTVPAADLSMECFDATAVATWAATASANDNCDGTLTVIPTYTAPTDNCNQTVTVTFTATDACGNIGTVTKVFTVDDNTAPVVTVPAADLSMECFDATAVATWAATASANDNCDGTLTVTPTYTAPTDNCNQTVTVTFTATDACGNIGTVTKGFTVDDNTAPVVTVPAADLSMECFDATAVATWAATASANDNCDGTLTVIPTYTAPTDNCNQTVTVTFTATDACGNIGTVTKVFTVDDNTAPVITCPANITVTADLGQSNANITIALPSVSDNCDANVTYTNDYTGVEDASGIYNLGTTTVTYTATDNCGNSTQCSFTVTVNDEEAPEINCPPTITVSCIDLVPAAYSNYAEFVTSGGTATDNNGIDQATFALVSETSDNNSCPETISRVYTISDTDGNASECTQLIIINDDINPVLTVPADVTVECDSIPAIGAPTATDNCDADVTITYDGEVRTDGACQDSYTLTRTWTAADNCSNTHTVSQTITVEDTTNPVAPVAPNNISYECIADVPAAGDLTAIDNCAGNITVTGVDNVDNTDPCNVIITRTWTFTDNCTNSISISQTITVTPVTPPVVPANAGSTVECIADATQPAAPVVTDVCGNDITPVITENADPTCEGDKIYTFTYTDCAGNISVYTFTYTIDVTTAPVVPANAGSTVECIADATQPAAPVVTDVCGNDITPVITENADPTCEGDKIYTFTYTDCAGNISVYTYTYTIDVTTAPVVPANAGSTVECIADATQPAAPVVTDVCGNDITPVITENADPTCEGDKIYTFTYTDCASNISVYTYTYTIDLTDFILPVNGLETVDNLADAVEPTPPTVTDNCGNPITPVLSDVSNTPDCQGSIVYTFTYEDCAGNSADWTYTYTVILAPFTLPADEASTVECIADAITPTPPTVFDVNGNEVVPVMTENDDPVCEGEKIYTFTYTDCAGNTADWIYTYTIDVTTAPVVPANAGSTVECIADATQPAAPVVTDVCGNDITPVITENADPTCEGDKIYTFTYTDCAGNISVYTYTYTIDVTTAPVVPANAGSTVECIADATQPAAPVVTDVCGNDITPVITENADPTCEGDKIYTFTYTDCAGNISVYTYTYTIDVTTAPVVPANAGSTVECIADATQPAAPVVTDVCGNGITPVITENADPTCEGEKIYTFTYTDCAGNISVYTYTYTIDVTTAPVVPANAGSTVECIADATQPAAPVVTDVCGNDITPVITENADPTCEGDKIYTFTYTDCAGNNSVYTYTYTIDLTDFILPVNGLETVDNLADAVEPTPPTVTDNCGNPITPVLSDVSNTPDCQGSIVYTFTYEDCAGNSADWTYTYTVILAPFTLPADEASTVECIADAITPTPPTVFDANGNEVVPVMTENDDPVCEGEKIYTFTYTDCAGNTADWIYTYTIDVTTAPVVPANAGSTVECIADATQPAAPVVTDVCGNDITPVITENADPTCEGDKIYTFTYTDCAGNISVYTYTYTIDVTTAPVVPANAGSTVECIADATQPAAPVVTDVCGNDITPVITENADPTCEGDKIYTFHLYRLCR